MPKTEAARTFGVSLSSVKSATAGSRPTRSRSPPQGRRQAPKTNAAVERLLEEDVQRRPYAAVRERAAFLGAASGVALSVSTVRRLLSRLGFSQKTESGRERARGVREGGLEGRGLREARSLPLRVRGRDGLQHISLSPIHGWSRVGERLRASATRNRSKRTSL